MRRFTGYLYDHRRVVVIGWFLILVALLGVGYRVGPAYQFDVNIGNTESLDALDLLDKHNPAGERGEELIIVWHLPTHNAAGAKATITGLLDEVSGMPHVATVTNPYTDPRAAATAVSKDGRTALSTVTFDAIIGDLPPDDINAVMDTAMAVNTCPTDQGVTACDTLAVAVGGTALMQTIPPKPGIAEALGIGLAIIILLLAFASVLAAVVPVLIALVALGSATGAVMLVSHVLPIPSFATSLMMLLGIGVGIDYALFVISRHRGGLMRGMPVRDSVLEAFDTSGRAVLFAGVTVLVSLFGIFIAGIGFMNGLAVAASIGVAFTMLTTLTLLPALLGFMGVHVLGRRAQRDLRDNGPHELDRHTAWGAWARRIQQHPWLYITATTAILAVLAIPATQLRLGSTDQASDPIGSTTRFAATMLNDAFGEGSQAPIILVTEEGQADALNAVAARLASIPGIAAVSPVQTMPDGEIATLTIIPTTRAQAKATSDLVHDLRSEILPAATDAKVYVTGGTAVFTDVGDQILDKLPWFLLGVLSLSSLLLLAVFRSIAIPIKAAAMNLLVAGAAFGVLTAFFQWGWAEPVFPGTEDVPLFVFMPILLLAILFGLSMDYQVFLVSRIREEWDRTGDNATAVRLGLSETGKVITAAALIMVFVFAAFLFSGQVILMTAGLGLASAIFLDAFLIRSLLVPALMQVLGKWNWWIPRWLDRMLPKLHV